MEQIKSNTNKLSIMYLAHTKVYAQYKEFLDQSDANKVVIELLPKGKIIVKRFEGEQQVSLKEHEHKYWFGYEKEEESK